MNDKAKIAALRAAVKQIANAATMIERVTIAKEALALTADDAEQAPLIAGMKIVCDPSMEPGAMKFVYPNPAPVAAEPAPKLTECRHCGFMVALNQAPADAGPGSPGLPYDQRRFER